MLDGNPWVGAVMIGHYNFKEAWPIFVLDAAVACVILIISVVVFLRRKKQ